MSQLGFAVAGAAVGAMFGAPQRGWIAGAAIFCHVFSRAARLPASATPSRGVAGVAATGPSTFALLKNGTVIGAVLFAAGEAAASFAVAAAVDFAAGDVLVIAAPDPQDATPPRRVTTP